MLKNFKSAVRDFWDEAPCGTRGIRHPEGSPEFFAQIEKERDEREPFIRDFARFDAWKGKRVLEVGFGAGTDLVRFARAGAVLSGIDYTAHAVRLARQRLRLDGLEGDLREGDAESLPFEDASFDFVYSWGVIHHTEDTGKAAREILRVTKPGAQICVMVYNRRSLVALQCWLLNGLLRGKPWVSVEQLLAAHVESPGTHAYTTDEALNLFLRLEQSSVTPVVTPYDCRLGRRLFLPAWVRACVPAGLGWFLVVQGTKPL